MARSGVLNKRERYLNALRQAGRRITEQRRRVCEFLSETDTHPTPYQVYEYLSQRYPDISRATVYNTLNALRDLGAIVEIGFGADHTHYDTETAPHVNLICLRCHSISDHDTPIPIVDLADLVEAEERFRPVGMRVDVYGFCRACQERKRDEIRELWRTQRSQGAHQGAPARAGDTRDVEEHE